MNAADTHIANEEQRILQLLDEIADPEVPVLSVNDLGIIRGLHVVHPTRSVEIIITPTYSGCPAMEVISMNIRMMLLREGYDDIQIRTILSPAWSTDWISEEGKKKLKAYGVAPPGRWRHDKNYLFEEAEKVQCPQCNSYNTRLISEFGSTACKSLYQCNDCQEPFDHFKCH